MVISSDTRMGQHRDADYQEDAPTLPEIYNSGIKNLDSSDFLDSIIIIVNPMFRCE